MGALNACFFAKRGFHVDVYEAREGKSSMNITAWLTICVLLLVTVLQEAKEELHDLTETAERAESEDVTFRILILALFRSYGSGGKSLFEMHCLVWREPTKATKITPFFMSLA